MECSDGDSGGSGPEAEGGGAGRDPGIFVWDFDEEGMRHEQEESLARSEKARELFQEQEKCVRGMHAKLRASGPDQNQTLYACASLRNCSPDQVWGTTGISPMHDRSALVVADKLVRQKERLETFERNRRQLLEHGKSERERVVASLQAADARWASRHEQILREQRQKAFAADQRRSVQQKLARELQRETERMVKAYYGRKPSPQRDTSSSLMQPFGPDMMDEEDEVEDIFESIAESHVMYQGTMERWQQFLDQNDRRMEAYAKKSMHGFVQKAPKRDSTRGARLLRRRVNDLMQSRKHLGKRTVSVASFPDDISQRSGTTTSPNSRPQSRTGSRADDTEKHTRSHSRPSVGSDHARHGGTSSLTSSGAAAIEREFEGSGATATVHLPEALAGRGCPSAPQDAAGGRQRAAPPPKALPGSPAAPGAASSGGGPDARRGMHSIIRSNSTPFTSPRVNQRTQHTPRLSRSAAGATRQQTKELEEEREQQKQEKLQKTVVEARQRAEMATKQNKMKVAKQNQLWEERNEVAATLREALLSASVDPEVLAKKEERRAANLQRLHETQEDQKKQLSAKANASQSVLLAARLSQERAEETALQKIREKDRQAEQIYQGKLESLDGQAKRERRSEQFRLAQERRSSIDESFRDRARQEVESKKAKSTEVLAQKKHGALDKRRLSRVSSDSRIRSPMGREAVKLLDLSAVGGDPAGSSSPSFHLPDAEGQQQIEAAAEQARRKSIQLASEDEIDDKGGFLKELEQQSNKWLREFRGSKSGAARGSTRWRPV